MSYKRAYEILLDWAPQRLVNARYGSGEDRCALGVQLPTKLVPRVAEVDRLNGLDVGGIARHEDGTPGKRYSTDTLRNLQDEMLAAWYATGMTLPEAIALQEVNDSYLEDLPLDDDLTITQEQEMAAAYSRYVEVLNFLRFALEQEEKGIPFENMDFPQKWSSNLSRSHP